MINCHLKHRNQVIKIYKHILYINKIYDLALGNTIYKGRYSYLDTWQLIDT